MIPLKVKVLPFETVGVVIFFPGKKVITIVIFHLGGHRVLLHWHIHRRPGNRGHLVGREGAGLGRVGKYTVGGGPQAPAVRLSWTAEVTPAVVGIRAAVHP